MRLVFFFVLTCVPSFPADARRAAPPVQELTVKKGEKHEGLAFPEGTKLWVQVHGGGLTRAELAGEFTWSGVKLLKGTTVELLGRDQIQFTPVAKQRVADLSFEAGEAQWARVTKEGVLTGLWLAKEKELRGFRFAAGCELGFHPNGQFAFATKLAAQEWRGLHLAEGGARFHEAGSLKQALLAKESGFQGYTLAPDPNPANVDHVELHPDGKLKAGLLAANAPVQGLTCGKGKIAFFVSGKLETCALGADTKVSLNGYPKEAKAGDTLFFADDGRVVGWGGR